MKYQSFEEYLEERPYKHTRAFNSEEWEAHIYEIWQQIEKEMDRPEREYTIVLENGNSVNVQADNYMAAKKKALRLFDIKITEIASIL